MIEIYSTKIFGFAKAKTGISTETTNLCSPVSSLTRVSVLLLFLDMKNTLDSHYEAERIVDRIKNMVPARLERTIQPCMELWEIIDQ